MKRSLLMMAAVTLLCCCGEGPRNESDNNQTDDTMTSLPDDGNLIRGLACDGCNDTIAIFLRQPYQGSDPDTLNILNASRQQKVFGRPHVGDKLILIGDENDSTQARMMIVLNDLIGQWCYQVKPTLRLRADVEGHTQSQQMKHLPDSVKELLNKELEYGIYIKDEHIVTPIGWKELSIFNTEDSPVEYPTPPVYNEWHIANGQLILRAIKSDSLQQGVIVLSDTTDLIELKDSTLVLRFSDGNHTYYKSAK